MSSQQEIEPGPAGIEQDGQFSVSRIQAESCRRFTEDMLHMAKVTFRVMNVSEDGDFRISVTLPFINASMDDTVSEAMRRLYPRLEYIGTSMKNELERRLKESS